MKKKAKLIIGCFYLIYGGTPHPSLVVSYNAKHKTYISIKFGTTKGKHMTRIHPIQNGQNQQYVHNRPVEGTRDDYSENELLGMQLDERDNNIIETIKNKVPIKTKNAKKRYEK